MFTFILLLQVNFHYNKLTSHLLQSSVLTDKLAMVSYIINGWQCVSHLFHFFPLFNISFHLSLPYFISSLSYLFHFFPLLLISFLPSFTKNALILFLLSLPYFISSLSSLFHSFPPLFHFFPPSFISFHFLPSLLPLRPSLPPSLHFSFQFSLFFFSFSLLPSSLPFPVSSFLSLPSLSLLYFCLS